MEICVLGPLSVRVSGQPAVPLAMQLRKVTAVLAVNANRFVPVADLFRELWPDEPPRSAKVTVQSYIVRLRKVLAGEAGCALLTRPGGYLLHVEPGVLDLHRFQELATEGGQLRRAGQDELAVLAFRDALAIWQGPVLPDIEAGPVLEPVIARLAEARNAMTEQLVGCELRLGRHLDILGELSELVLLNPLHEGLHARFMIALYRSGRRGAVLEVYKRLREALARDLGLDPSPALRRLHLAVLQDDPLLEGGEAQGAHWPLEPSVA
jgi:SARP family transcriptional regulator, regulator of embCAB operon